MGKQHITKQVGGHTMLQRGQFGDHHETPLRDLGMRVAPLDKLWGAVKKADDPEPGKVESVPVSQLLAGQHVVNTNRAVHFAESKDRSPAQGVRLNDKVMLTDGHHRVAGALLRGNKTYPVEIKGRIR